MLRNYGATHRPVDERGSSGFAELVALPVGLILTPAGGRGTEAAKRATRAVPIVFAAAPDPVRNGFVARLPRPGGNVTGLGGLAPQLQGESLQLLRELVPGVSRVTFRSPTAGAAANGWLQDQYQDEYRAECQPSIGGS